MSTYNNQPNELQFTNFTLSSWLLVLPTSNHQKMNSLPRTQTNSMNNITYDPIEKIKHPNYRKKKEKILTLTRTQKVRTIRNQCGKTGILSQKHRNFITLITNNALF